MELGIGQLRSVHKEEYLKMKIIYNQIGEKYALHRKADKRISDMIYSLLDLPGSSFVAEIGAGTGNYSNAVGEKGHLVFAVEPSIKMLSQVAHHNNVKWIKGTAENIPIRNKSVDGIFVILALHHFQSIKAASFEFDRICKTGSVIIFTFDPRLSDKLWLNDYFPSIWKQAFIAFAEIEQVAKSIAMDKWDYEIVPFPLPDNLSDGFMAYAWKHPELYLDDSIRNSMSAFALADPGKVDNGLNELREDIKTGMWDSKYGSIKEKTIFDAGYRFIRLRRKQE